MRGVRLPRCTDVLFIFCDGFVCAVGAAPYSAKELDGTEEGGRQDLQERRRYRGDGLK
jgi:hypothetical protein